MTVAPPSEWMHRHGTDVTSSSAWSQCSTNNFRNVTNKHSDYSARCDVRPTVRSYITMPRSQWGPSVEQEEEEATHENQVSMMQFAGS